MLDLSKQYELSILIKDKPITEYYHDNNFFVEGRAGSEFSLKIRNNSAEQIEAILAVDGISVLDGNEAGPNSRGFVIDPWQFAKVDGWAVSNTTAQAFFFTEPGNSYGARTKRGSNIGVIGAMIFRKMPSFSYASPVSYPDFKSSGYSTPRTYMCSVNALPMNSSSASLGTGWGDQVNQNLSSVSFTRRDPQNPDAILAIYYDDRRGLERRGIVLDRAKSYSNPFPAYSANNGFCKAP